MAQPREEVSPSRIELVVLACLSQSKPPTDAEIGEALQQLVRPAEPPEATRNRAGELLAGLVRRAWVTGDDEVRRRGKPRKGPSPRKLTESGKRVLRTAFNLSRAPTWAQVRDKHLPCLALGLPPGSELTKKACTEDALMAAVLCTRFGIRDACTPLAVSDAIIADALGMPRGKLTLEGMRVHVLSRGAEGLAKGAPSPDLKGYADKFAAWLAGTIVGADGSKHRMARALARRWVTEDPHPLGVCLTRPAANDGAMKHAAPIAPVTVHDPAHGRAAPDESAMPRAVLVAGGTSSGDVSAPSGPSSNGPPTRAPHVEPIRITGKERPTGPRATLEDGGGGTPPTPNLLEVVRETIPRVGAEGRFGEKVYVSAIWRTIERDRKAGGISLDKFKSWLVAANRDGWLVLARADLIGAMDAKQVIESEINDRGATFHFVLDQRNGASVSQRESHAR